MNRVLCRYAAILVLASALPEPAIWNQAIAGAPARPVVVELFTSQGCSSCPPADALLGELSLKSNVIALGFHVDYWDSIGWRDRFSMPQATERQRGYAQSLNLSSAFTPQVVIDGRHSIVGSDRQRLTEAIAETSVATIDAIVVQDNLVITLNDNEDRHHYDVIAVAYLPQAVTNVRAGENSGKTLTEFCVVRQIRRVGIWDGKAGTFQIPVKSFPSDASRVAVLIQQANAGSIIAAAAVSIR